MSGHMIVGLIERCSSVVAAAIASTRGRRNTKRNAHTAAMARVSQEAAELRRTLLVVCYRKEYALFPPWVTHIFLADVYRGKATTDTGLVLEQRGR